MRALPQDDLSSILERMRESFLELNGARLFITGGTGFFGIWILESLLAAIEALGLKTEAVILTRRPEQFRKDHPRISSSPFIKILSGSVETFPEPEGEFSHLIHAAASTTARDYEVNPFAMVRTIVNGTERVLEFAKKKNVKKLLFTSSGAVYGKQPSELTHVSEAFRGAPDPLALSSTYGEAKRLAEHLCVLYSQSMQIKIARCFAFVGPYLPLDQHFAIGNFIGNVLKGETSIQVRGDGTPYRSYLYPSDLMVFLWTLLFRGKSGEAYNVGSDEGLPLGQVAGIIAEKYGKKREVQKTPRPDQPNERYVPSIQKIKTELQVDVTVSLLEAIQKTVNWHRQG